MKKMHPDFFTRMMWKGRTGLPMNVAIDDGYAYDFQQLPFVQVAFQMDTDEDGNMDNWWNIFCRLADGDRHLEPTTSRPMYMGVVGRLVVSGRKRLLRLTSTHLKAREIQSSLMRIGEFMKRISAIAEQLDFNRAWELIILAAFRKWLGGNRAKGLLPEPLAIIG